MLGAQCWVQRWGGGGQQSTEQEGGGRHRGPYLPVDVQVVHVLDGDERPLAAHAWPCEVRRERARTLSAGLSALREQLADRDFPKVGPRFTTFGTAIYHFWGRE